MTCHHLHRTLDTIFKTKAALLVIYMLLLFFCQCLSLTGNAFEKTKVKMMRNHIIDWHIEKAVEKSAC